VSINTLEQALEHMGKSLTNPDLLERARQATADGNVLEITVLVSPAKQGIAVTMHSLVASDRISYGRLIRLK